MTTVSPTPSCSVRTEGSDYLAGLLDSRVGCALNYPSQPSQRTPKSYAVCTWTSGSGPSLGLQQLPPGTRTVYSCDSLAEDAPVYTTECRTI